MLHQTDVPAVLAITNLSINPLGNRKAHQRWLDVWVMFIGFCVTLAVPIPPASAFPNPCVNP